MYRSLAPVPLPLLLLYRAAYAAASALAPLLVLRLSPLLLLSLADRLRLFIDGGGVGDDCGRVAMVASSAMTRAKRERCPRRLLPAADVDPVAGVGDGKEDVVFGVVVGLAVMPSAFDGRDASTRCHRPRFILPRRSVRLVEDGGWPLDDDDPGPDVAVGSLAGTSPPLNGPVLLPLLPPVPPPPLLLLPAPPLPLLLGTRPRVGAEAADALYGDEGGVVADAGQGCCGPEDEADADEGGDPCAG